MLSRLCSVPIARVVCNFCCIPSAQPPLATESTETTDPLTTPGNLGPPSAPVLLAGVRIDKREWGGENK